MGFFDLMEGYRKSDALVRFSLSILSCLLSSRVRIRTACISAKDMLTFVAWTNGELPASVLPLS